MFSVGGDNGSGQLGDGTTTSNYTANPAIAGLSNVTQISAGDLYSCAVSGGGVYCWGDGVFGKMGPISGSLVPISIPQLTTGVVEVQTGVLRTCARLACGQIRCSGNDQFGNLGDGTTANSLSFVTTKNFSGNGCPP